MKNFNLIIKFYKTGICKRSNYLYEYKISKLEILSVLLPLILPIVLIKIVFFLYGEENFLSDKFHISTTSYYISAILSGLILLMLNFKNVLSFIVTLYYSFTLDEELEIDEYKQVVQFVDYGIIKIKDSDFVNNKITRKKLIHILLEAEKVIEEKIKSDKIELVNELKKQAKR